MSVYATILAGGAGTRLWPRSRRGLPKHLLTLQGDQPLLRQTYERVRPLVDETFVLTEESQVDAIMEVLPELTRDRILVEPVARGTTSALGLAAMTLAAIDPEAVMLSVPADHVIGDGRRFRQAIRRVIRLATQSRQLVTVGLTPYYPATGFGYIRTDGDVRFGRTTGLKVAEFVEKPPFDVAVRYVDSGAYFWNLAIFCWRASTLVEELEQHAPIHHGLLREVLAAGSDAWRAAQTYRELPNEAIDYSVMEKTDRLLLIPARFHWVDVGTWSELHSIMPKDVSGNAASGEHLLIDSESSLFDVPGKFVAAIGVKDLVVVESADALLVCHRSRAQEVKSLVEHLKRDFAAYA